MRVGTKELKNRLSHYLRQVRAGERITVTDRGAAIAILVAPAEDELGADEAGLAQLEREGLLTRGSGRRWTDFEPIELPEGVSVSAMVIADRERPPTVSKRTRAPRRKR